MKKLMTKQAKWLLFILLSTLSFTLTFKLLAWHSESMATAGGYGDNHALITMDALDAAPGFEQYPDLIKFYKEIWDATSGVLDDVGDPLGLYPYTAHKEGWDESFSKEDYVKISGRKWTLKVMDRYLSKGFGGRQGAYWYIGQIAHLTEDMAVPAHACYIPHGGFFPQFLTPVADLLKHCDQFEFCADFKINCEGQVTPAEEGQDPWLYPELCRNETRAKIQDVVMAQWEIGVRP